MTTKLVDVTVNGFTASLNCTRTTTFRATPVAPDGGSTRTASGPLKSGADAVVNVRAAGAVRTLPLASRTPATVSVYVVPGLRRRSGTIVSIRFTFENTAVVVTGTPAVESSTPSRLVVCTGSSKSTCTRTLRGTGDDPSGGLIAITCGAVVSPLNDVPKRTRVPPKISALPARSRTS